MPAIITAARGGAIDHAWSMFRAGGFDRLDGDPAALAVKGRLLKEKALRAVGDARARNFADAATAYAEADRIAPQPYTRANVAALSLLAGNVEQGRAMAGDLLAWLERETGIPEKPYYLVAARAEALLVRGDVAGAEQALAEAIEREPAAWEDHAVTLHQMRRIAAAQGLELPWLARFQPPRSLHYAGHLGIGDEGAGPLREAVDQILRQERIGFAYGALGAGAEIVVAEQVLRAGAELHLILPTDAANFAQQSVTPYGGDWVERFEACLAQATSIRLATRVSGGYEPLAALLAGDWAMGAAVLNAEHLASEPFQLLVIDEEPGRFGDGIGKLGSRWQGTGRGQHIVRAPRTARIVASGHEDASGRPDRRLAAMLHIAFEGLDLLDEGRFAEALDEIIGPFRRKIAAFPIQPTLTLPAANARLVAFPDTDSAWAYAKLLLAEPLPRHPLRIGGHFALVHWLDEPAALIGHGVAELGAIAAAAIPGVLTASEAMAKSLFVSRAEGLRAEPVGEVDGVRLFAMVES
ncbi:hypothetical protein [Sphingomonas sp. MMS24-J13]|uniref:hypothetical protein n=1 Tax=Sphingomonas sp. MMS24-J13 TaxID=3238686 RepID=UPI00384FB4F1